MGEIAQIEPSYDDLAFPPQMPRCDIDELKAKLEQSEKMRDLQVEYACRLKEKLKIAEEALKELSEETLLTENGGRFVNSSASIAQQALKEIEG